MHKPEELVIRNSTDLGGRFYHFFNLFLLTFIFFLYKIELIDFIAIVMDPRFMDSCHTSYVARSERKVKNLLFICS